MTILTLNVSQLVPGMILADDVYTIRKERILYRNTIINQRNIMKLKLNAIKEITVYIPSNLAEQLPAQQSENVNEFKNSVEFKRFKKYYTESIEGLKSSFMALLGYTKEEFDSVQLLNQVEELLKVCRSSLRTFDMLQCMREFDDLIYVHSMNVTLVCSSFGSWLNLSQSDMTQLLLACMLHDVGKLKIPQEIIHKPTKLTPEEFDLIKQHPMFGYELIHPLSLDPRIDQAILMHHERCDKTGYPNKLGPNEITDFARIIAIADVYDAMTANRIYRNGICPFDVIRNFEEEGYQKFDAAFLIPFLEHLALAYMNSTVRLSNSLVGEVVMINKLSLSRPIVKVGNQFFDLSKERDISIISVL